MNIEIFKAAKKTKRFNKNQTVFVVRNYANHLVIVHKYRGKGRYVCGYMDKWNNSGTGLSSCITTDIKQICVSPVFVQFLERVSKT